MVVGNPEERGGVSGKFAELDVGQRVWVLEFVELWAFSLFGLLRPFDFVGVFCLAIGCIM